VVQPLSLVSLDKELGNKYHHINEATWEEQKRRMKEHLAQTSAGLEKDRELKEVI